MGMHTIRWRSGATDSGQIPCLPMLGLRQCALSPFPACCYRRSLLANTDLQHGACLPLCRDAVRIKGDSGGAVPSADSAIAVNDLL